MFCTCFGAFTLAFPSLLEIHPVDVHSLSLLNGHIQPTLTKKALPFPPLTLLLTITASSFQFQTQVNLYISYLPIVSFIPQTVAHKYS
jgi:hypothetical protein